MEKEQKAKFLKMVESYCKLKGINKNSFLQECKQKFGTDISLMKGVLEIVKSDPILELVDVVISLSDMQNMEIPPIKDVETIISENEAPFDEEIYKSVLEEFGDNK